MSLADRLAAIKARLGKAPAEPPPPPRPQAVKREAAAAAVAAASKPPIRQERQPESAGRSASPMNKAGSRLPGGSSSDGRAAGDRVSIKSEFVPVKSERARDFSASAGRPAAASGVRAGRAAAADEETRALYSDDADSDEEDQYSRARKEMKRRRVMMISPSNDDDARQSAAPRLLHPADILPKAALPQDMEAYEPDPYDDTGSGAAVNKLGAYAETLSPLVLAWPPEGSLQATGDSNMDMDRLMNAAVVPSVTVVQPPKAVVRHVVNKFLARVLHAHQVEGVVWMHRTLLTSGGCILADDMGLGKTLQTITLISALLGKTGVRSDDMPATLTPRHNRAASSSMRSSGSAAASAAASGSCAPSFPPELAGRIPGAPVLILCPSSLKSNWVRELAYWGWIRVRDLSEVKGSGRDLHEGRGAMINDVAQGRADVLLAGHELGLRGEHVAPHLQSVDWGLVVVDEAHVLKNAQSEGYRSFSRIKARGRMGLTGTPLQNDLGELWALLDLFVRPREGCGSGIAAAVAGAAASSSSFSSSSSSSSAAAAAGSPDPVGSWESFNNEYARPITRSNAHNASAVELVMGVNAQKRLKERILDRFILRRMKAEVDLGQKLPQKHEQVVYCELGSAQRAAYIAAMQSRDVRMLKSAYEASHTLSTEKYNAWFEEAIEHAKEGPVYRYIHSVAGENGTVIVRPCDRCKSFSCLGLALLDKMNKLCAHLEMIKPHPERTEAQRAVDRAWAEEVLADPRLQARVGGLEACSDLRVRMDPALSGKMQVLGRILDHHFAVSHTTKVLIFSRSVRLLHLLEDVIRTRWGYRLFVGSMNKQQRDAAVADFNTRPDVQIMLLSLKAGGVGLNLTAANVSILFDPDWNPSNDAQAQDRAYRIGQTRDVTVYRLVTMGTIEEAVYLRQVRKAQQNARALQGKNNPRLFEEAEFTGFYRLIEYNPDGLVKEVFERYKEAAKRGKYYVEEDRLAAALRGDDTGGPGKPVSKRKKKEHVRIDDGSSSAAAAAAADDDDEEEGDDDVEGIDDDDDDGAVASPSAAAAASKRRQTYADALPELSQHDSQGAGGEVEGQAAAAADGAAAEPHAEGGADVITSPGGSKRKRLLPVFGTGAQFDHQRFFATSEREEQELARAREAVRRHEQKMRRRQAALEQQGQLQGFAGQYAGSGGSSSSSSSSHAAVSAASHAGARVNQLSAASSSSNITITSSSKALSSSSSSSSSSSTAASAAASKMLRLQMGAAAREIKQSNTFAAASAVNRSDRQGPSIASQQDDDDELMMDDDDEGGTGAAAASAAPSTSDPAGAVIDLSLEDEATAAASAADNDNLQQEDEDYGEEADDEMAPPSAAQVPIDDAGGGFDSQATQAAADEAATQPAVAADHHSTLAAAEQQPELPPLPEEEAEWAAYLE